MFIISKRNFLVRRADGSPYVVKKDYIGEIPQDIFESSVIQGAIKGGLVATPETYRDKALYKADAEATAKADAADIRPDAENKADVESEEEKEAGQPKTRRKAKTE